MSTVPGAQVPKALYLKLTKSLAVVGGGSLGDRRNEETYSKYATGVRIKKHPSRRQQQRGSQNG